MTTTPSSEVPEVKIDREPRAPELRNPFELSIFACLAVMSGLVAFSRVRLPGSLAAQPSFYAMACAWMFFGGALFSIAGQLWPRDKPHPDGHRPIGLNGYAVYQTGCIGLLWGCILYGVALATEGTLGNIAIIEGFLGGLGIGVTLRWLQVARWWRRQRKKARTINEGS